MTSKFWEKMCIGIVRGWEGLNDLQIFGQDVSWSFSRGSSWLPSRGQNLKTSELDPGELWYVEAEFEVQHDDPPEDSNWKN